MNKFTDYELKILVDLVKKESEKISEMNKEFDSRIFKRYIKELSELEIKLGGI